MMLDDDTAPIPYPFSNFYHVYLLLQFKWLFFLEEELYKFIWASFFVVVPTVPQSVLLEAKEKD